MADVELTDQSVALGGSICYELAGLTDGASYEARVSYPASVRALNAYYL